MPHSPSSRPNTRTEALLIKLWSEILRVDAIARTDDFFQLGGDSLAAMRMLSHAERLGIYLPADATFDGCSLAELAALADCRTHAPAEGPSGRR
jgi:acyl carrier protein